MSDNPVVRFLGGDNMRKSNEFGEQREIFLHDS